MLGEVVLYADQDHGKCTRRCAFLVKSRNPCRQSTFKRKSRGCPLGSHPLLSKNKCLRKLSNISNPWMTYRSEVLVWPSRKCIRVLSSSDEFITDCRLHPRSGFRISLRLTCTVLVRRVKDQKWLWRSLICWIGSFFFHWQLSLWTDIEAFSIIIWGYLWKDQESVDTEMGMWGTQYQYPLKP